MPLRIFTVKFEEKWTDGDWIKGDDLDVSATDAESAIVRAKKHLLATKPLKLDDGSTTKISAVRILGVMLAAEADI